MSFCDMAYTSLGVGSNTELVILKFLAYGRRIPWLSPKHTRGVWNLFRRLFP